MRKDLICILAAMLIILSVNAQDVVLEKVENGHRIEVYALNNTDVAQEVTLDVTLVEVTADKDLPVVMVVPAGGREKMTTLTPEPLKPWSYKTRYNYRPHIVEEPQVAPVASYAEPDLSPEEQPSRPERTFEAGPDIDDQEVYEEPVEVLAETEEEIKEQAPADPVGMPPSVLATPTIQKAVEKDTGPMGPPLSTDDMPIPAKYYEKPAEASAAPSDNANVFEIPAESVVSIGSPEKVIVYGQPGCPRCQMAKDYFAEQNVPFEYMDITVDESAKEEMTERLFASGFTGGQFVMPVVYVDDIAHYSIKELDVFLESLASRD